MVVPVPDADTALHGVTRYKMACTTVQSFSVYNANRSTTTSDREAEGYRVYRKYASVGHHTKHHAADDDHDDVEGIRRDKMDDIGGIKYLSVDGRTPCFVTP